MTENREQYKEVLKEKKKALSEFLLQKKITIPEFTGKIELDISQGTVGSIKQTIYY